MSWLAKRVRPRIKWLMGEKSEGPDNLWRQCPSCKTMLFHRELANNSHVCLHCNHHFLQPAQHRFEQLFDEAPQFLHLPETEDDPLKFKDTKRYVDRLRDSREKTGQRDAILSAYGRIGGRNTIVAALDFNFMAGTMGQAVGCGFAASVRTAVSMKSPFIVFTASGGARMQEGVLSLMQLPRTIAAVRLLNTARLPYIVVMTNPTTGGVSASFAMLGDVQIAEPGATIGFAGPRVIEQTVREKLPEGFQTSEYLHKQGMVDLVCHRHDIKKTVIQLCTLLCDRRLAQILSLPAQGGLDRASGKASATARAQNPAEEGSSPSARAPSNLEAAD